MATQSRNPKSVAYTPRGAERIYYLSHELYGRGWLRIATMLKRLNQFLFHVNIPPPVKIGKRLQLPHGGFGIIMNNGVRIGNDAIIFQNVTLGNGSVTIGDRVYIGAGAVLIGDITIGDDVHIGANTFVNFDVPDNSTVVGVKGKILKREST